ncbi:MAG: zf-HC2 domain-containing protein [Gemmatimonadetes bacterium]|nr:zf-HC2 domain-containing protein [Gemmatimonadota bacterium]
MMRDCPDGETRDLLPLFARGRLAPLDQARVESHIETCGECAAELRLLREVARAYDVAPVDVSTIVAGLPTRRPARAGVPFHRQPLWRVAAGLTLMITGAAAVLLVRDQPALDLGLSSIDSLALAPTGGGKGLVSSVPVTGAAAGTTAASTDPIGGGAPAMGFGVSLSDLTDAQLESLLASLERIEGTVLPDPETMAKVINPSGSDQDTGRES